jgi:hypothetical protein
MIDNKLPKDLATLPTGTIYLLEEPEYIGKIPVRQDIEILPNPALPVGEQEWEEHGSLLITIFGVGGEITDQNAIRSGMYIMVRSARGGWYLDCKVKCNKKIGLYAIVGEDSVRVPIKWCSKRGFWVATKKV